MAGVPTLFVILPLCRPCSRPVLQNIPTGMPLVYELDGDLKPIKSEYLGDPEKVAAAMAAVANQGKAKK